MILTILKFTFLSLIIIPFIYMVYDVTADIVQRFYEFFKRQTRPALARVRVDSKNK